jgi:uncharacterized protein YeaO (DUF488 family)
MGETACFAHLLDSEGRLLDGPVIRIARAYDKDGISFGRRILVDRVWPRGLTKDELQLDRWIRNIAPSPELRRWFGHRPARWPEFQERYRAELESHSNQVWLRFLAELARGGPLVLLYGARDRDHNQAVVLQEVLQELLRK